MNDTIWDIQESIKREKAAIEDIQKSCNKWQDIISEITNGVSNISTSSHEWRIRFECQYHYNKMLMKQIQHMRTEIRTLCNGRQLDPELEAMYSLKTVGDWRKQIKDLNVEKWSLKSLLNMYDRQLDVESMAYHKAHGVLHSLTNDIRNTFATIIHEQEKADDSLIISVKKSRKLKPIAKVPPIKHLPLMEKENQSYSNAFQRHQLTEIERRRTTFSGLLPPDDT